MVYRKSKQPNIEGKLYLARLLDIYIEEERKPLDKCQHMLEAYGLLDGDGCTICGFTKRRGIRPWTHLNIGHLNIKVAAHKVDAAKALIQHLDKNYPKLNTFLLRTAYNYPIPKVYYSKPTANVYHIPMLYDPRTHRIIDIVPEVWVTKRQKRLLMKEVYKQLKDYGFRFKVFVYTANGEVKPTSPSDWFDVPHNPRRLVKEDKNAHSEVVKLSKSILQLNTESELPWD